MATPQLYSDAFFETNKENVAKYCVTNYTFSGDVHVIPEPRLQSIFTKFTSPALVKVISQYVKGEETGFLGILGASPLWIATSVIGLVLLLAVPLWVFCMTECYRTRCTTCFSCCFRGDRKRKFVEDLSRVKLFAACLFALIFGVVGLSIGNFMALSEYDSIFDNYNAILCDYEQTQSGLALGASNISPVRDKRARKWPGMVTLANKFDEVAETLTASGEVQAQIKSKLQKGYDESLGEIESVKRDANNLQAKTTNHVRLVMKEVQHTCVVCTDEVFADLTTTMITFDEDLSEVSGDFGLDQSLFTSVGEIIGNLTVSIANVTQTIVENYDHTQNAMLYAHQGVSYFYIFTIVSAVAGFVFVATVVWSYSCFVVLKMTRVNPGHGIKGIFACQFVMFGIYAALCLFVCGLIAVATSVGASGCHYLRFNFMTGADPLPGEGESGELFKKIVETCIFPEGSRNLTDLLDDEYKDSMDDKVEAFETEFENIKERLCEIYQTRVPEVGDRVEGIQNFMKYSWIMLPASTSDAVIASPALQMFGMQLQDVTVDCDDDDEIDIIFPTQCTGTPGDNVTIKGLMTLNDMLNPSGSTTQYCMASVLAQLPEGDTIPPYCLGTFVTIDDTFDVDENSEAIASFNEIASSQPHIAANWLPAMELAVQKEIMFSRSVFDCGPDKCNAPEYMSKEEDESPNFFTVFVNSNINPLLDNVDELDPPTSEIESPIGDIKAIGFRLVEASNCQYVSFAFTTLSNDICDIFLPMLALHSYGLCVAAVCSILMIPLSWKLWHYIRDSIAVGLLSKPSMVENRAGDAAQTKFISLGIAVTPAV